MITYTLKLTQASSIKYKLYENGVLVSDSDLATLFATSGSAYFDVDLDNKKPSSVGQIEIINSQNQRVLYDSSLGTYLKDGLEYKGAWNNSATAFSSFTLVEGRALSNDQLSFLMGKIKSFVFYIKETDVHSGTGTEIALYKDAACTQKYTVGEVTSAYTSGKQIIARTNYGSYIQELKCTSISSPVEITDANLDQQGFHLGFFFGGYSGGGNGYCVYIGTYWGLADTDAWDYSME